MIRYPDDAALTRVANATGLPVPVVARDVVRLVAATHLSEQGFFSSRCVLAGSMALRLFDSPRFTVLDADLSADEAAFGPPDRLTRLLAYEDEDLVINPAPATPADGRGSLWQSKPVDFEAAFTNQMPARDSYFKVDLSLRGLLLDGVEKRLEAPHLPDLWDQPPMVYVMHPHEIAAEKLLGWAGPRLAKHYADLAYISAATRIKNNPMPVIVWGNVRDLAEEKLVTMSRLQPDRYASLRDVDEVISALQTPPSAAAFQRLTYTEPGRTRLTLAAVVHEVQMHLVPALRS